MKKSNYNTFFKVNEQEYVFNAMTCSCAKIDNSFKKNLENVTTGQYVNSDLINNMRKSGVIVEDCFDELEYLKLKNFSGKFSSNRLGITIAPTMMCNFACPYCYENPQPLLMKDEVAEAIVRRVENAASSKQNVFITWFGGEPLLAQKIIWRLSEKMMKICEKAGVKYSALMVSNCYLANDEVIKNMVKYNIKKVQVTIDGTPEIHNARRKLKNSSEPTFYQIVKNTKKMLDEGIKVNIRINVDRTNLSHIENLLPELKKYGLENSMVYLGKVTDSTEFTKNISETCLDTPEYSHELIKWASLLDKNGFSTKEIVESLYPKARRNFCLADSANAFAVDGHGNMYKCWHDIGNSSKIVGNILDKKMDTKIFQDRYSILLKYQLWNPFKFEKCIKCSILPICMGGCPSNGIQSSEPSCIYHKYNLVEILKFTVKQKTN